jgi:hypothetical protein
VVYNLRGGKAEADACDTGTKGDAKNGLNRELNPGPPPYPGVPEEGIILLDH